MPRRTRPRRGSLQYYPRKRAKRVTPRFKSWPASKESVPLGFFGYKAGMTHVLLVDSRNRSPTSGQEIFVPVTVIEAPPMIVLGIRGYREGLKGMEVSKEVWVKKANKYIQRRVTFKGNKDFEKDMEDFEADLDKFVDIRIIVSTQPHLAGIKKTPDIGEIGIGGNPEDKLNTAKGLIGKEVRVSDVFSPGELVDVKSVTKGKGFQGVVKRFGVFEFGHKKEKTKRGVGCIGPWNPPKVMWTVPRPGQMGFHTRTEFNKTVLIVSNPDEIEITPAGGFLGYGVVKNDYIVVSGSIPGPAKRIVGIRKAIRPGKRRVEFSEIRYISLASKQGV